MDRGMIEKTARLARIKLSESEMQELASHLSKALEYFESISNIDTAGVSPLISPNEDEISLRPDESRSEFTADEILANAPTRQGNLFSVPPVI